MDLRQATERALEIRRLYAALETKRHGRAWNVEELALGFVGDVGDLAKLVQGAAGMRAIPDLQRKLGHELADCLWSVLVLADQLGIDLAAEYARAMDELEGFVRAQLER
jgi:NTP pyrophosphatase (non-canonical NTP hydrolase)